MMTNVLIYCLQVIRIPLVFCTVLGEASLGTPRCYLNINSLDIGGSVTRAVCSGLGYVFEPSSWIHYCTFFDFFFGIFSVVTFSYS